MQDFRRHLQCDVEGDLTSPVVWPISPHRTPVLRTISMAGHHVERGIDCARLNSPSETGQAWLKKIIIKKKLNDDKNETLPINQTTGTRKQTRIADVSSHEFIFRTVLVVVEVGLLG